MILRRMSTSEKLHGLLFAATYIREILDDPATTDMGDINHLARVYSGITDFMAKLKALEGAR
jgi:hypothetical protein